MKLNNNTPEYLTIDNREIIANYIAYAFGKLGVYAILHEANQRSDFEKVLVDQIVRTLNDGSWMDAVRSEFQYRESSALHHRNDRKGR